MRNIQPENPLTPLLNERSELRQTQSRLLKEFETALADYSQSNDSMALLLKAAEINYDNSKPNLFNTSKKIAELNKEIAEKTNDTPVVYDNYQIKTKLYNGIVAIVSAFQQTAPELIVNFNKAGVALIREAANLSSEQLHELSTTATQKSFADDGAYLARNLANELKPIVQSLPNDVKQIVLTVLPELSSPE